MSDKVVLVHLFLFQAADITEEAVNTILSHTDSNLKFSPGLPNTVFIHQIDGTLKLKS